MTFWSDLHGIIYGVRTMRVYKLIQDLPYAILQPDELYQRC